VNKHVREVRNVVDRDTDKDDDADGLDEAEAPAQKIDHGRHLCNYAGDAEDREGTYNEIERSQEEDNECKKKWYTHALESIV